MVLLNNRIRNHSAGTGGGVFCTDGTYTLEENAVDGNSAGAGIYLKNATASSFG